MVSTLSMQSLYLYFVENDFFACFYLQLNPFGRYLSFCVFVVVKVRLLYLSTLHQRERFATLNGFHYSLNLYLYPITIGSIYLSFCVFVFVKARLLYLSTLHQ